MAARIRQLVHAAAAALAVSPAATGALAADAGGSGPAPDMRLRFESAHERYEQGHYDAAFDRFAALADDGHCEAARIARQMARYGNALYGLTFVVAPVRLERWRHLPGCPAAKPSPR